MKSFAFPKSSFVLALLMAVPGLESPAADPGSPVSIEALVADALQNNPELKFYEAGIAAARAEARNAGRLAPPALDTGLGYKRTRDQADRLLGDGVAWSVTLQQPFEWPGRTALRKAIANRDVALAELGLARFRTTLAAKVRALAHDLAVAQQRATSGRAVAERLRKLLETLLARDPAGLTPLLETRVIEAAAVKAEHTAAEAEHDVEHLIIELNYWRRQPPATPVRVIESPPRFGRPPGLETLYAAAATNNFDLRVRVAELEQQGFKIALARNERFPSLAVGPVISEERAGDRERIVGLAVSLPLPLWQDNRAKIDAAEARRTQAEVTLESARRRLESDVADYWHKYEHALGVLAKWRPDAIAHFQEAAELADRHYRVGAVPLSTYVELQRQYVEA
ncbi:MAG TPA: TolC family protein, partial [Methylomirabilota bacterium]|nr:TolC family protein [Methylomirabilota bacterium]